LIPIGKSTLRLPDLKIVACLSTSSRSRVQPRGSGLTLSVASLPRLQRRGSGPPNGSI